MGIAEKIKKCRPIDTLIPDLINLIYLLSQIDEWMVTH